MKITGNWPENETYCVLLFQEDQKLITMSSIKCLNFKKKKFWLNVIMFKGDI